LTTGLLDAATLGNCLIRVVSKNEPDTLLTKYAETRRNAWLSVTDPESTAFKHRLSSTEPQHVKDREAFFHALNYDPKVYEHLANSMNEVLEDLEA
jgi:2-polyprenyl-6-methoxyphenol hydroxylase-like FAD-dependent oxidoreductase